MTGASKTVIQFTPPMECLPVSRIPEGDRWVYELKLDGYRAQAIRDGTGIPLLSRRGKDLTRKYPRASRDLAKALAMNTVLDGELVAFDDEGKLSFNALQNAASGTHVIFFAFDILTSEGKDLKRLPLRNRKELLKASLNTTEHIQISDHFSGPLSTFLQGVKQIGGEGVVAKRLDGPYEAGRRSGSWSKMRINIGQEFVIGGFTPGSNGIEALVVGYYEGRKLIYAARVRSGLVPASRRELYDKLKSMIMQSCPFVNLPDPLHQASELSPLNLKRIRASKAGGTWRDWDKDLVAACHKKKTGKTFPSVYGRMAWDQPSPTMTTQFFGFGNGRFGHPRQNRAISLREGAILQSFPRNYKFVAEGDPVYIKTIGRLIGNAVPVKLGEAIGKSIMRHVQVLEQSPESGA